jgi:hypothetical protein
MKNLITLSAAIILATAFSASAQKPATASSLDDQSKSSPVFTKIVANDDIDLVLQEAAERSIEFAGTNKDVSNVTWNVKDRILFIGSKTGSLKEKMIVKLAVNGLEQIEINGESSVKTEGSIHSPNLDVLMNGMGSVNIRNTGKVNVQKADEIELHVMQYRTGNETVKR